MSDQESVRASIFRAIEKLNQDLPEDQRIPVDSETEILGPNRAVDSLTLVELVLAIERQVKSEFGVQLNLAEEIGLLAREQGTIGDIAAHVAGMVRESNPS